MFGPQLVLEDGVKRGLHLGAQLYVNFKGKIIFDFACGEARTGVPMRTDSIVQWFSSGKPLTAIAIAQLCEKGLVELAAPVSRYLPEFAQNGKGGISIEHLLTHTGGFRGADKVSSDVSWEEAIQYICEAPLEDGWVPGERAGYSTVASWYVLGEVVQRITRMALDVYLKQEVMEPAGMSDTWLRLPFEKYREYGDRLALMHDTAAVKRDPMFMQDAVGMAQCRPGSSARGPIRELGYFYEMLLAGGTREGRQIVRKETIELFTRRHRVGMFDETFLHKMDFGYGFIVNSNRYGAETVPYGYGRYVTEESYGHSGVQSSCAFGDSEHQLVVAWVTNGTPGERPHQKRHREINNAVYEFLKLGASA